jgi:hypothetical protein
MIINCYNKRTSTLSLHIEFPEARDPLMAMTGYAFDEPHEVFVDDRLWGEWPPIETPKTE